MRAFPVAAAVLFVIALEGAGWAFAPGGARWTLMPGRDRVTDQGEGTWLPTVRELEAADAAVGQVSRLEAPGWGSRLRIERPETYYRQVVPVLQGGVRLLYVNAFCDDPPPARWREDLYEVVDGMPCYWQATYDPQTRRYFGLRIKGRA